MTQPYTSTHIVHVTDTTDRNAYLKIRGAYSKHAGAFGLRDSFVDVVPAKNTLDIGVVASEQVHNTERPDRLLIAHNCAPAEKEDGTVNNHRSDFYYADLGDGIFTGGTINGLELAYVKGRIKALFQDVTTNALGSQFRSLQVLPKRLIQFATREEREKLIADGTFKRIENIDDHIAGVPDTTHVIEVDEPFNNVKLWLSQGDRITLPQFQQQPGVQFRFGEHSIEYADARPCSKDAFRAVVSPTLFAAPLGTNVIALNSSSRVLGDQSVPMIATIRKRPAETAPRYDVPQVGLPVFLQPERLTA